MNKLELLRIMIIKSFPEGLVQAMDNVINMEAKMLAMPPLWPNLPFHPLSIMILKTHNLN